MTTLRNLSLNADVPRAWADARAMGRRLDWSVRAHRARNANIHPDH